VACGTARRLLAGGVRDSADALAADASGDVSAADARPVGTNHIRCELQSDSGGRIQAIAFRAVDTVLGEFLFKNRGKSVHVAGSLSGNYWNGNRTVQFRIVDAARA